LFAFRARSIRPALSAIARGPASAKRNRIFARPVQPAASHLPFPADGRTQVMSLRRYFTRRPMLARPTHTPPSAAFAPRDPAPAVAPASASDTAPAPATASAVAVEEAPQAGPAPAALDLAFVLTPAAAPPAPAMAVEPPAAPAAPPPPTAVPVRVIERFAPPPRKFPFHKVRHHRPGDRPARPPASRTAVSAALLINLLSLAALGAAIYDRITEANSSENNLRADNTSFKLKTTSAMTRAVSEPRSSHSIEIPVIEEKTERLPPPVTSPEPELVAPPPVAPTQEPPVGGSPIGLPPVVVDPPPLLPVPMVPVVPMEPVAPPPAEPPLLVPVAAEPATQQLPTAERLWQPYLVSSRTYGETPMLRNWSMIKLASALAVSLAVTPASFAGEKENKDVKSILDRLEKMEKELPENVEKLIGKKLEGALLENFKILKKNLEKEIDELK